VQEEKFPLSLLFKYNVLPLLGCLDPLHVNLLEEISFLLGVIPVLHCLHILPHEISLTASEPMAHLIVLKTDMITSRNQVFLFSSPLILRVWLFFFSLLAFSPDASPPPSWLWESHSNRH